MKSLFTVSDSVKIYFFKLIATTSLRNTVYLAGKQSLWKQVTIGFADFWSGSQRCPLTWAGFLGWRVTCTARRGEDRQPDPSGETWCSCAESRSLQAEEVTPAFESAASRVWGSAWARRPCLWKVPARWRACVCLLCPPWISTATTGRSPALPHLPPSSLLRVGHLPLSRSASLWTCWMKLADVESSDLGPRVVRAPVDTAWRGVFGWRYLWTTATFLF